MTVEAAVAVLEAAEGIAVVVGATDVSRAAEGFTAAPVMASGTGVIVTARAVVDLTTADGIAVTEGRIVTATADVVRVMFAGAATGTGFTVMVTAVVGLVTTEIAVVVGVIVVVAVAVSTIGAATALVVGVIATSAVDDFDAVPVADGAEEMTTSAVVWSVTKPVASVVGEIVVGVAVFGLVMAPATAVVLDVTGVLSAVAGLIVGLGVAVAIGETAVSVS